MKGQQKVEARNFDIRKSILKFDDVLNDQRHVIFSQRKKVMESENSYDFADKFLEQIIEELIEFKNKNADIEKKLLSTLGGSFNSGEIKILKTVNKSELKTQIINKFQLKRNDRINILGEKESKEFEKRVFLQLIDQNWKNHIQYLEQLRQVIGLRSYGQRDPLIEYKKEAFNLFESLLDKLKYQTTSVLLNIKILTENHKVEENKNQSTNPKCLLVLNKGKKISRNEICEATNKKYKNCCGGL